MAQLGSDFQCPLCSDQLPTARSSPCPIQILSPVARPTLHAIPWWIRAWPLLWVPRDRIMQRTPKAEDSEDHFKMAITVPWPNARNKRELSQCLCAMWITGLLPIYMAICSALKPVLLVLSESFVLFSFVSALSICYTVSAWSTHWRPLSLFFSKF
jgi:hypothetical protein